ncbi:MAG: aldehyde:ferredoxin oxidoreductase [Clostridia bacterium]|nr:aldehyde:ferredoxin oxidoreductase [Clostridia bacterium]
MFIYRVNLTTKKVTKEEVSGKLQALGGRALTSTVIANEVDPLCHPLGPKNKLVFAPGLLSGTSAPSSGRLSVGAKSPLTGTIKESNAGGLAAIRFAKLGIKALIVEGQSPELVLLKINKDGITIEDASEHKGKGNYELNKVLPEKYGSKVAVITIGPAGEYKMTSASIAINDGDYHPTRHAGRGGLGAVMGSKNLKAIVIDDTGASGVPIADPERFKSAAKAFSKMLIDHPVCGQGLPTYGTAVLINILNEAGGLPTKNFRVGRFDGAEKISGEFIHKIITERKGKTTHACHPGCVMRCSQVYNNANGDYLTAGFEYETIWAFGSQCSIEDIDAIAKADRFCDDLGLDTIEMGVTMSVAMEAGIIEFGDAEGMLGLFKEIKNGTPLGRVLGNGAKFLGQAYGVTRVPVVKGQSIPAYDPRAVKGVGVTYATTPMGADHTAGYSVATNILKVGGHTNPLDKAGQVELSRNLQIATAAVDSTGLCLFVAFCILDNPDALPAVVEMLNAQYNLTLTLEDVTELGKYVLKTEREFNNKAGFTSKDDRLPEFFKEEFPPHGVKWDFTGEELDELFNW